MNEKFTKDDVNEALSKEINLSVGDVLSEAWDFCKDNLGQLVGYGFIYFIISNVLQRVLGLIIFPFIGDNVGVVIGAGITSFVIQQVLLMALSLGFYVYVTRAYKGDKEFGNFFQGFTYLGQALMFQLMLFVFALPIFIAGIVTLPFTVEDWAQIMTNPQGFAQNMIGVDPTSFLPSAGITSILFLGYLILTTFYTLTNFVLVDKEVGFWDAMEASRKAVMKNVGSFIIMFIILALINFAGALVCGLGLIVTIPLSFCAQFIMYKRIYGGKMGNEFEDRISSFGE
ncbi:MAG: hypothetical protein GY827_01035 [Cytophagales bacterium]|nr:hypothetical protein [Cytophagales bacterium]